MIGHERKNILNIFEFIIKETEFINPNRNYLLLPSKWISNSSKKNIEIISIKLWSSAIAIWPKPMNCTTTMVVM